MKKVLLFILTLLNVAFADAQGIKKIPIGPNEKWYGAAVNEGEKMPFAEGYSINLNGDTKTNQAVPGCLQKSVSVD